MSEMMAAATSAASAQTHHGSPNVNTGRGGFGSTPALSAGSTDTTVMTTLLEDVLFDLPDPGTTTIVVDGDRVRDRLKAIVEDEDLRKYIL